MMKVKEMAVVMIWMMGEMAVVMTHNHVSSLSS